MRKVLRFISNRITRCLFCADSFGRQRMIILMGLFLFLPLLHAQEYLWPTDASHYMTSTFCEFRPRHYHAALDIKTWQRSGYKIFAIEDGYVYRIRISANGYGKAIYLKLKDGNYVVYAHLSGFNKALEAYCDSLRYRNRALVLDTYPPPSRFPVKKGDVLGFTGETGIGVPHLHFEIRDAHQRPINPLRFYKDEVIDTRPPGIKFVALIPKSAHTYINFVPDTLILQPEFRNGYRLNQPIYLTGKAYLSIRTYDLANGNSNFLDIYGGELWVNDSLVYQVRYDRFSYGETHLIELDKNFSLWRKGLKIYHDFYRHPANSLPFYQNTPPGGGILSNKVLHIGKNKIVARIYDYHGNTSELKFTIIYHDDYQVKSYNVLNRSHSLFTGIKSPRPLSEFKVFPALRRGSHWNEIKGVEIQHQEEILSGYYYHLNIPLDGSVLYPAFRIMPVDTGGVPGLPLYIHQRMTLDSLESSSEGNLQLAFFGSSIGGLANHPQLLNLPNNPIRKPDIYQISREKFYVPLSIEDVDELSEEAPQEYPMIKAINTWKRIIPGRSKTVSSPNHQVKVHFPSNACYDTLFVKILEYSPSIPLNDNYRYLSPIYDVQPFDQPLNYGALITFQMPDSIKSLKGVNPYYWDSKKGWLFLPTQYLPERHEHTTRITSLEKFVLIQDTIPPVVEPINLNLFRRAQRNISPLRFSVKDEMAGIYNETQIEVWVDGNWTLFEYDPEEEEVIIPPRFLLEGQHQLTIKARDNAGNLNTFSVEYIK
ncbi:MAG: M23 family metallopeptidase [Calditrichaeota bacterium]|nr:MAG: M23 family metallopeptidase [Calditrichota bacterium]